MGYASFFQKFNENHDPSNGEFSDGSGGGGGSGAKATADEPVNHIGYKNYSKAYDDFQKEHASKASALTLDQTDAVTQYTTSAYRSINGALRGDPIAGRGLDNPAIKGFIDNIDKALASSTVGHNMLVYRGLGGKTNDALEIANMVKKGNLTGYVLDDKGYSSTSPIAERAANFASGTMLQIALDKDQHGLFVESISANTGEHELILPRNTKVMITGKTTTTSDGYKVYPARVVPSTEDTSANPRAFYPTSIDQVKDKLAAQANAQAVKDKGINDGGAAQYLVDHPGSTYNDFKASKAKTSKDNTPDWAKPGYSLP